MLRRISTSLSRDCRTQSIRFNTLRLRKERKSLIAHSIRTSPALQLELKNTASVFIRPTHWQRCISQSRKKTTSISKTWLLSVSRCNFPRRYLQSCRPHSSKPSQTPWGLVRLMLIALPKFKSRGTLRRREFFRTPMNHTRRAWSFRKHSMRGKSEGAGGDADLANVRSLSGTQPDKRPCSRSNSSIRSSV